jgi:hypothetical protein
VILQKGSSYVEGEHTPLFFHRLSSELGDVARTAASVKGFAVVDYVSGGTTRVTLVDRATSSTTVIVVSGQEDGALVQALAQTPAR